MTREDMDRTAELKLELETQDPGVCWGQDFMGSLEVDMVLSGDVNPLVPQNSGEEEC